MEHPKLQESQMAGVTELGVLLSPGAVDGHPDFLRSFGTPTRPFEHDLGRTRAWSSSAVDKPPGGTVGGTGQSAVKARS